MKIHFNLLLLAFTMTACSAVSAQGIEIELQAKSPQVRLNQPLVLTVVLNNLSGRDISVNKSVANAHGEQYYKVFVWRDGHMAAKTPYGQYIGNREIRPVSRIVTTLAAGESVQELIDLNTLYKLDMPGTYTVQAERADLPGEKGAVKSNKLEIRILP